MTDKTKAIIAHITLFGWLASLVMYFMGPKTELNGFYLRQVLGLIIIMVLVNLVFAKSLAMLLWLGAVALWVMSLLKAVKGEKFELPYIGKYFQQWFTFI